MAIDTASFTTEVDNALAAIFGDLPYQLTTGFYQEAIRNFTGDIFVQFRPSSFSQTVTAQVLDACWLYPWNTRKVAYHDNIFPRGRSNAVAITQRHVIMSELGSQLSDGDAERFLVWIGYDENGLADPDHTTQTALTYVSWIVGTEYSVGINGSTGGPSNDLLSYRICYLRDNLPAGLVCKMLNPATLPGGNAFLDSLPVSVITPSNRAGVQMIHRESNPAYSDWPAVGLIPNESLFMNYAYKPVYIGLSGQPVFLMHGADTLVYFGHASAGAQVNNTFRVTGYTDNTVYCPNYCHPIPNQPGRYFLDRILEACVRLNSKYAANFGGDPNLLPTYVT